MEFKELRERSQMSIKQFSEYFNIPYRTVQDWEYGKRKCNDYIIELIHYKLVKEGLIMDLTVFDNLDILFAEALREKTNEQ